MRNAKGYGSNFRRGTNAEAFMRSISPEPNSGCWFWMGSINSGGYGQFNLCIDGRFKTVTAHKWYYELHRGAVPDGLEIDHKCRVRCCVNPNHICGLEKSHANHLDRPQPDPAEAERGPTPIVSTGQLCNAASVLEGTRDPYYWSVASWLRQQAYLIDQPNAALDELLAAANDAAYVLEFSLLAGDVLPEASTCAAAQLRAAIAKYREAK